MTETVRLGLPLIAEAQAQKHVTHNEALLKLDAIVQLSVRSREVADPPAAPVDGEAWIVAAGGTGEWSGHDGEVAVRQDGAWVFHVPGSGWVAWVEDERRLATHDGNAWVPVDAASLGGHPASDYVLTGDLAAASVGNADTVDGRHAEEFALLTGATFTGGVTAAGFTGDGGGLTNVNAAYLGGLSPDAYALLSGAAFTGDVSAARFSGDGSGLANVDAASLGGRPDSDYVLAGDLAMASVGNADTVDGRHAEEFALLSGATFTGRLRAQGMYVGRPELDRSAGGGSASIELGGWSGAWSCNVQDGTGRVNFRWNATAGPQPAFLVDGDRAVEWDIDGWGGFGLTIRESGINTGAGSPVSFETIFSAGRRGIKGFVPFILPSYSITALPDPAWLGAGAMLFVPDGGDGPMVAFSDGTNWRRMNDGQIIG